MNEIPAPVDPLGEALHVLRMSGSFYSRCDFSAPWGLILPPFPGSMMFHVITSGHCWLEVEGNAPQLLAPGDLALVPHGEGHRLVSEPGQPGMGLFDAPRELASECYEIIRLAGGGAPTTLICGIVNFDHPASRQLIALLPRVIRVQSSCSPQSEWIQSTLRLMAAEARELRPGGETVVTRLADILVIQAVRSWIEDDPAAQTGWLGALKDRQIGHALTLIHRDPTGNWTVAQLAHQSAMSRSAFAARFTQLVGETPIRYLTRWRMQVALDLLRQENATVGELALRLGYQSEAAFSRAFKRTIGVSPGVVRRAGTPSEPNGSIWTTPLSSSEAYHAASHPPLHH